MSIVDPDSLMDELRASGALPDNKLDLGTLALKLAALDQPGLSLGRYEAHLKKLVDEVGRYYRARLDERAADTPETWLQALKEVLWAQEGYTGDIETYDDLQNANLVRVIERRKGMPITLSILYIHVARALGWNAEGLNVPGHFVVRLDKGATRLIFDPFDGCEILQAADLRRLVKQTLGPQAELSSSYFEPASNRTMLIRLQNNIKIRQIENEDYEGALKTVQAMRAIDPEEYRLLLDAGVLSARTDRPQDAAEALEAYIERTPDNRDRRDAALLLQEIRKSLN